MLLSSLPEARIRESGLHVRADMPAKCPSSVCSSRPVEADQSLMVQSAEPEAIQRPSGEKRTIEMGFLWPRRIRVGL
jgi:hypothetical protein